MRGSCQALRFRYTKGPQTQEGKQRLRQSERGQDGDTWGPRDPAIQEEGPEATTQGATAMAPAQEGALSPDCSPVILPATLGGTG